jgi:murein DD-endopeptidase MepM/ murein hydrolase activator NlpD
MGSWRRGSIWLSLVVAGVVCDATTYHMRRSAERRYLLETSAARDNTRQIQEQMVLFTDGVVPARLPFATLLQELGIDAPIVARLVASAQPVFDLRHVRAGNRLMIGRSVWGDFRALRYWIDSDRVLSILPRGGDFHSEIEMIPSHTDVVGISGEVSGSLFEAVLEAGEKPELAMRLANIFGWDLDFYTDPRPGDMFRVVVEKRRVASGEVIAYGRILAAEYDNRDHAYRAVLFHDPSGNPAYYTPEGRSMKKAFLHSPLKFAAPITSHFSAHRFHPILKEYRPHLGIDYGAPTGTPVQTIGDGRVIFAGAKGQSGNLVEILHANGYTTYYMHLSRILVRSGERVEQGQCIGLVGMTGLATGPHLDFRIQHHGEFLNFLLLPLPPTDPVSKRDWNEFAAIRDGALARMPSPDQTNSQTSNAAPATPGSTRQLGR